MPSFQRVASHLTEWGRVTIRHTSFVRLLGLEPAAAHAVNGLRASRSVMGDRMLAVARYAGAGGSSLSVRVDAGVPGATVPSTTARYNGGELIVTLARTSGAVTATVSDVAAAVRALVDATPGAPVSLSAVNDFESIASAVVPTALQGGRDAAVIGRGALDWEFSEEDDPDRMGGLFFSEMDDRDARLLHAGLRVLDDLASSTSWGLWLVPPLDEGSVRPERAVQLAGGTLAAGPKRSVSVTGIDVPLHPGWGAAWMFGAPCSAFVTLGRY